MTGHDDNATIAGESYLIFSSFVSFTGHWLYCVACGRRHIGEFHVTIWQCARYSVCSIRALVWLVYFSHRCWQRLHSAGILFSAAAQLVTNSPQKITISIFEIIRQRKEASSKVPHQDAIKHGIIFRETVTFIRTMIINGVLCMTFCLSVILLYEKKISHIHMIAQCVFQLVLLCRNVPEKNFLKIRYNTADVAKRTSQKFKKPLRQCFTIIVWG